MSCAAWFREIDAEAYILVDGDDTYPAEAAPEMVAAVTERQADMVVGDRLSSTYYTQNKRPGSTTSATIWCGSAPTICSAAKSRTL